MSHTRESYEATKNDSNSPWYLAPITAAIGGAIGGYVCFAFEGLKKRAQSKQSITRHSFQPKELFRGSTAFATSVGTTSVAQFTIKRALYHLPNHDATSATWNIATSIASGMCGAFFSTFVENIILQQQLKKTGPTNAICELFRQGYARPWLGMPELMMREGGFALTMLYLASTVGEYIKKQTNNNYACYAGEIGVGVAGAFFTHPFDTTATFKQRNLVKSSTKAVKAIYKNDGLKGFYKGVGYRAILFTGCMLVIPWAEKQANILLTSQSMFSPKPPALTKINLEPSKSEKGTEKTIATFSKRPH